VSDLDDDVDSALRSWNHPATTPPHPQETTAECTRLHKAMIIAYNGRHFPKLSKLQGTARAPGGPGRKHRKGTGEVQGRNPKPGTVGSF